MNYHFGLGLPDHNRMAAFVVTVVILELIPDVQFFRLVGRMAVALHEVVWLFEDNDRHEDELFWSEISNAMREMSELFPAIDRAGLEEEGIASEFFTTALHNLG